MHGITALTFNSNQADLIYKVIGNALVAQQNTWQTLLKALILVDHLVMCAAKLSPPLEYAPTLCC